MTRATPSNRWKKFPKGSPEYIEAVEEFRTKLREFGAKEFRNRKDYLLFPLLSLPFGMPGVLAAAAGTGIANLMRNVWAFSVIFCGHFPDGAEYFKPEDVENETRGGWYRRQILGSVNFTGGRVMRMLSGNLCHQVEHHLFLTFRRIATPRCRSRSKRSVPATEFPTTRPRCRRQFGTAIRNASPVAARRWLQSY